MKKPKTNCELCKCLNLIAEGKLHPSKTIWNILNLKYIAILEKEPKAISSISACKKHNMPMLFIADIQSVGGFVEEVFSLMEKFLASGAGARYAKH